MTARISLLLLVATTVQSQVPDATWDLSASDEIACDSGILAALGFHEKLAISYVTGINRGAWGNITYPDAILELFPRAVSDSLYPEIHEGSISTLVLCSSYRLLKTPACGHFQFTHNDTSTMAMYNISTGAYTGLQPDYGHPNLLEAYRQNPQADVGGKPLWWTLCRPDITTESDRFCQSYWVEIMTYVTNWYSEPIPLDEWQYDCKEQEAFFECGKEDLGSLTKVMDHSDFFCTEGHKCRTAFEALTIAAKNHEECNIACGENSLHCGGKCLTVIDSMDCPVDAHLVPCSSPNLKCGDLCEGDGECGTSQTMGNCGQFDVYRVSVSSTSVSSTTAGRWKLWSEDPSVAWDTVHSVCGVLESCSVETSTVIKMVAASQTDDLDTSSLPGCNGNAPLSVGSCAECDYLFVPSHEICTACLDDGFTLASADKALTLDPPAIWCPNSVSQPVFEELKLNHTKVPQSATNVSLSGTVGAMMVLTEVVMDACLSQTPCQKAASVLFMKEKVAATMAFPRELNYVEMCKPFEAFMAVMTQSCAAPSSTPFHGQVLRPNQYSEAIPTVEWAKGQFRQKTLDMYLSGMVWSSSCSHFVPLPSAECNPGSPHYDTEGMVCGNDNANDQAQCECPMGSDCNELMCGTCVGVNPSEMVSPKQLAPPSKVHTMILRHMLYEHLTFDDVLGTELHNAKRTGATEISYVRRKAPEIPQYAVMVEICADGSNSRLTAAGHEMVSNCSKAYKHAAAVLGDIASDLYAAKCHYNDRRFIRVTASGSFPVAVQFEEDPDRFRRAFLDTLRQLVHDELKVDVDLEYPLKDISGYEYPEHSATKKGVYIDSIAGSQGDLQKLQIEVMFTMPLHEKDDLNNIGNTYAAGQLDWAGNVNLQLDSFDSQVQQEVYEIPDCVTCAAKESLGDFLLDVLKECHAIGHPCDCEANPKCEFVGAHGAFCTEEDEQFLLDIDKAFCTPRIRGESCFEPYIVPTTDGGCNMMAGAMDGQKCTGMTELLPLWENETTYVSEGLCPMANEKYLCEAHGCCFWDGMVAACHPNTGQVLQCPSSGFATCCDVDQDCFDGTDDWCCEGSFFCSNDGAEYAANKGGILCPDPPRCKKLGEGFCSPEIQDVSEKPEIAPCAVCNEHIPITIEVTMQTPKEMPGMSGLSSQMGIDVERLTMLKASPSRWLKGFTSVLIDVAPATTQRHLVSGNTEDLVMATVDKVRAREIKSVGASKLPADKPISLVQSIKGLGGSDSFLSLFSRFDSDCYANQFFLTTTTEGLMGEAQCYDCPATLEGCDPSIEGSPFMDRHMNQWSVMDCQSRCFKGTPYSQGSDSTDLEAWKANWAVMDYEGAQHMGLDLVGEMKGALENLGLARRLLQSGLDLTGAEWSMCPSMEVFPRGLNTYPYSLCHKYTQAIMDLGVPRERISIYMTAMPHLGEFISSKRLREFILVEVHSPTHKLPNGAEDLLTATAIEKMMPYGEFELEPDCKCNYDALKNVVHSYSMDYGKSCNAWDMAESYCGVGGANEAENWCNDAWCYLPSHCPGATPSSFFPGKALWYSYTFCDDPSPTWSKQIMELEHSTGSMLLKQAVGSPTMLRYAE